ncbi:MAG: selenium-dependent molybdenum hydroxylase system protein YqeB family [Symbiobacteriaceae bacterium]|jgi:xanthine dehydrogenase accessory factor|nr:selenium-dependent molybdenum hydroxylase system protein YqeB family [Symbiobacteriaceae bacterium]
MILVKGAGELASGIAWRLVQCGFPVVMTEVAQPLAVRRTVSFCSAVYTGSWTVEGVTARLVSSVEDAAHREVPLLIDPTAACVATLRPTAVVDAIMAKRNLGTALSDAPVVVGVGPGFTAGTDCHAVVETQRGHWLGRVYYQGAAIPDTGQPAERGGHSEGRIVRAPAPGAFHAAGSATIGSTVRPGDVLGHVGGVPVYAAIGGILRGLVFDGTPVTLGLKIGDIDPVCEPERCHTISDKALAVAGGVLEALLHLSRKGGTTRG